MKRLLAVFVLAASIGASSGCTPAHASGTSYPDYGDMLSLSGAAILASSGAYTAGTTMSVAGNTRLSMWAKIVLASGTNLTAGINVQLTCGYNAASDVVLPVTWSDQATPTLQQTTTLTGTAGATVWHLTQSGSVTGSKAGCAVQARSANSSAGVAGDSIDVYVYGY